MKWMPKTLSHSRAYLHEVICYCGRNCSPLHFGHRATTSNETGRVKCFTCPQFMHLHASERPSEPKSWFNAFCASSRIFSSTVLMRSDWLAISPAPVVEDAEGGFADGTISASALSCSNEHICSTRRRPEDYPAAFGRLAGFERERSTSDAQSGHVSTDASDD